MKGLFIPGITAEMFRNGCLESIETLMAEGEIYDIEYPLEQEPKGHWIWNDEKTYCKCSECGIGMGHTEYDFCPNCGCRMNEAEQ